MTDLRPTIDQIRQAADRVGLVAFAKAAGVPYTTARDWAARGWEPKSLEVFTKFARAAANAPTAPGESAA